MMMINIHLFALHLPHIILISLIFASTIIMSLFKRLWHRFITSYSYKPGPVAVDDYYSSPPILMDQLPNHVVRKIFEKLCIGDRVRMRLVSKSWRRTLMQDNIPLAPEPPWLIVSSDSYLEPKRDSSQIFFQSLSEERIYRFDLLSTPILDSNRKDEELWFCGSSRGWLLIAAGLDFHTINMFLWNPVSRHTKKLPPLSTLPFSNQFRFQLEAGIDNKIPSIERVQVFAIGAVECVVAIIFTEEKNQLEKNQLALCTPHDQSWSAVGGENHQLIYKDILFHNGKLYVSCKADEEPALGGLVDEKIISKGVYTVHLTGGCDLEVNMLWFVYEDVADIPPDETLFGVNINERNNIVEHLVESCSTGELVVVSAIQDLYSHINTPDDDDEAPIKTFQVTQTRRFEVRRWITGDDCLEKVSGSIGEQVIFLGCYGSLSLPMAYVSEVVEADSIYFATDSGKGCIGLIMNEDENISDDRMYIVREQGVFNLQEHTIQITSCTS